MRRFLPVLVTAFVVGCLFRFGNQYEIPILRMFATQGIVVIGFMAARTMRRIQIEEGVRQVNDSLKGLPPSTKVVKTENIGLRPVWVVQTEKEKILIGGSDLPQSASVSRAARTVWRHGQELWSYAKEKGWISSEESGVTFALVLLRRRLASETPVVEPIGPDFSLTLLNPESIPKLFRHGKDVKAFSS